MGRTRRRGSGRSSRRSGRGGEVGETKQAARPRFVGLWRDCAAGVAVQTLTPLALVAKTGRPMWSARTKLTAPPSITAMG